MEGLTRMVSESLARHGFETPLDHRRLQWSRWFRCESSFSLLRVPSKPGLFALGEEVVAPGEAPTAGGKRLLAVFQVAEAEDLAVALGRLFSSSSPLRERFAEGRCFARYALVEDVVQRRAARAALEQWLASAAQTATGMPSDFALPPQFAAPEETMQVTEKESHNPVQQEKISAPAPLPSGF